MKPLKELKAQREGIEKISKIARAMEAIAVTRLHRYEQAVSRFRPFIQAQRQIIQNLALRLERIDSFWMGSIEQTQEALAILISSDRGFCGNFNNQLFQLIRDMQQKSRLSFIVIGKKGVRYLKKQNVNLITELAFPQHNNLFNFIQDLSQKVIATYQDTRQNIFIIFNEFHRHLLGQSSCRQLFPLEPAKEKDIVIDYLYEPEIEKLLQQVIFLYVRSEITAAVLESQAAEEMARMVAMTQARRNAQDLIKRLTLEYHKARQARITRELIEIVNAT